MDVYGFQLRSHWCSSQDKNFISYWCNSLSRLHLWSRSE